jgi:hypothetical protein
VSEHLVIKYYNNKNLGSNNHVDVDCFKTIAKDLHGVMYLSKRKTIKYVHLKLKCQNF